MSLDPFPIAALPASGFLRQSQLIGPAVKKSNTELVRIAAPKILPFSSATLWRMVKAGAFPAPVKLSERITAWRVEDVRAWMAERNSASEIGTRAA